MQASYHRRERSVLARCARDLRPRCGMRGRDCRRTYGRGTQERERTSNMKNGAMRLACAGLLALGLLPTLSAAKRFDACRGSTDALRDACTAGAQSDKALAIGKCDNLSSSDALQACRAQAAADAKDARDTCGEQRKFRIAVCARLGPAPYKPAIDPANF